MYYTRSTHYTLHYFSYYTVHTIYSCTTHSTLSTHYTLDTLYSLHNTHSSHYTLHTLLILDGTLNVFSDTIHWTTFIHILPLIIQCIVSHRTEQSSTDIKHVLCKPDRFGRSLVLKTVPREGNRPTVSDPTYGRMMRNRPTGHLTQACKPWSCSSVFIQMPWLTGTLCLPPFCVTGMAVRLSPPGPEHGEGPRKRNSSPLKQKSTDSGVHL